MAWIIIRIVLIVKPVVAPTEALTVFALTLALAQPRRVNIAPIMLHLLRIIGGLPPILLPLLIATTSARLIPGQPVPERRWPRA
ncbi:MAG: hypothetical protein CO140_02475 [Candidatus Moranbacteria bacterium CG_4_9_14_3_um_filter_40_7]|nr:MAG: hypothetical protein COS71_00900 [Candidatus Moranbacteria bacterium CG06_land_8_20_14_3_00_40_12]PJA87781.1 MAG: hypothetical protein CO140_02475 [Candidatus Moranbacteria bacterium CG_4_9_14_3_um_filter_40_7]